MRLDAVTAEIRPRSDWEAVDLGLALARRDFWRCLAVWWLAVLLPTVVAGWFLWDSPVLWLLLFWWWKPAASRMVLFELSRRLFGERPTWRESLRMIPGAWGRRFVFRFLWMRLAPWLPVTMAVEELEGLRGKAYKQRCVQLKRRGDGVVMWIYMISDLTAVWLGMAILVMVRMFFPEGQDGAWSMALETWNPEVPMDIPLLIMRSVTLCVMVAISLTDVFVSGAGFSIYINNRTAIEGWDVELAFKRLARRLGKVAVLVIGVLAVSLPGVCQELEESESQRVIREVKSDPAFKVHTRKVKVADTKKNSPFWEWLASFFKSAPDWLGMVFLISSLGLIVGLVLWLVWRNRHVLLIRDPAGSDKRISPSARVVMGMEVTPDSLPDDIPPAAWSLWREGRQRDALGLLYRGSISRVMELRRVEIQESDTEGDCIRRVNEAGPPAHPDYFRALTGAWMLQAYADRQPADSDFEQLCKEWPFTGKEEA